MKVFPRILLVVLFFSCSEKQREGDVLSENKMRAVMWDMIRADQYVADFLLKDSTHNKKEESVKLYEEIFRIHKITREQFKKSLDYYSSQPDLFRPIVDSLAKRKNEFTPPSTNTHSIPVDSLIKPTFRKRPQKR
jgi:hypothetical protein